MTLHPTMAQALRPFAQLLTPAPTEPRDRTPERDDDTCYYCGAKLNGADRSDLDGRKFHEACYQDYYDGEEPQDERDLREDLSREIAERSGSI